MFTWLFIAGKNRDLSLAELVSYLQARQVIFEVQYVSKEFFVVQTLQVLDSNIIEDLGGIIKIGRVMGLLSSNQVREAFVKHDKLVEGQIVEVLGRSGLIAQMVDKQQEEGGKLFFGVSVYLGAVEFKSRSGEIQRLFGSMIKAELAGCGRKARFMGFADKSQGCLSHVEVLKKGLVESGSEVLVCVGKDVCWFATTVAVHNPFEFQKRDVYKPRQRKIFGMPPRLAKIMINLSSCVEGKVLLDAFCGVGTVLQEALLVRANVVGTDINSWCVKASEENLEWVTREYQLGNVDFRVIQCDISFLSQKVGWESVDCIVSEPDLGPALRQVPTTPYAQKVIDKLTPLFFGFVEEAYKVLRPGGKLVLVTPYIVSRSKQIVRMPLEEKAKSVNFTRVKPFNLEFFGKNVSQPPAADIEALTGLESLIEIDSRHLIGREIHVFCK
ncbi:MAG: methyltransferase domain-containing protein [Candidatus Bathyarchaeota archaeon]|nr:methyltransferase domain-containing protein [Candidatus Termiticorpusculum sp.]